MDLLWVDQADDLFVAVIANADVGAASDHAGFDDDMGGVSR